MTRDTIARADARLRATRPGTPSAQAAADALEAAIAAELRCARCGEPANTVPLSMAGTMHRYGPTTHRFRPVSGSPTRP